MNELRCSAPSSQVCAVVCVRQDLFNRSLALSRSHVLLLSLHHPNSQHTRNLSYVQAEAT